jgi:hypothetical protein
VKLTARQRKALYKWRDRNLMIYIGLSFAFGLAFGVLMMLASYHEIDLSAAQKEEINRIIGGFNETGLPFYQRQP